MKCMSCPLLAANSGFDDYDCICLADTHFQSFPDLDGFDIDEGGCSRTDKWINAQNPENLKRQYWANEAARWEDYANKHNDKEKVKNAGDDFAQKRILGAHTFRSKNPPGMDVGAV